MRAATASNPISRWGVTFTSIMASTRSRSVRSQLITGAYRRITRRFSRSSIVAATSSSELPVITASFSRGRRQSSFSRSSREDSSFVISSTLPSEKSNLKFHFTTEQGGVQFFFCKIFVSPVQNGHFMVYCRLNPNPRWTGTASLYGCFLDAIGKERAQCKIPMERVNNHISFLWEVVSPCMKTRP